MDGRNLVTLHLVLTSQLALRKFACLLFVCLLALLYHPTTSTDRNASLPDHALLFKRGDRVLCASHCIATLTIIFNLAHNGYFLCIGQSEALFPNSCINLAE